MLGAGSFIPMIVTRLPIGLRAQEHTRLRQFQSLIGVNPLQTTWLERGTVSGRVALLLRSAEIQPLFGRFVRLDLQGSNLPLLAGCLYRSCHVKPALSASISDGAPAREPFLAFSNYWIPSAARDPSTEASGRGPRGTRPVSRLPLDCRRWLG